MLDFLSDANSPALSLPALNTLSLRLLSKQFIEGGIGIGKKRGGVFIFWPRLFPYQYLKVRIVQLRSKDFCGETWQYSLFPTPDYHLA